MACLGDGPKKVSEIVNIELEPLLTELNSKYKVYEGIKNVLKCYALQDHVKNTFIYRSPVSMKVTYTGDARKYIISGVTVDNQEEFNLLIYNFDSEHVYQLLMGFGLNIISKEDSLPMSIHPANYHKTDISRFSIVTGSYDCGKWFRPTHLSIFNPEEKDFEIKRGDPLFYVKFHTEDKVQLKRFNMNEEVFSHVESTIQVKKYLTSTKLNKLYTLYKKSKLKPLLIRAVESLQE
tara:strand:+ start:173 stop:877 length:705 start_codon:yes stop_codon:yes gene_type:complete